METILVTGGAGFIGSNLCDSLLSKEYKVICVDDFNNYYNPDIKRKNISKAIENKNFKLCECDITNLKLLRKIFEDNTIDKIAHLAARAGVRASINDPELYFDVNLNGTKNLLNLAKEFKIKKFVFGSSSSVYGDSKIIPFTEDDKTINQKNPYAESKFKAEELCKNFSDLDIICLRFFTVYGPRGRPDMAIYKFTKAIMNNQPIEMFGDGNSMRDYTYVLDIVDGVISALKSTLKFEIINLGGSNPVKLIKLISLIEEAVGKKAIIIKKEMPTEDMAKTSADISKAKSLLQYLPKTSIDKGIPLFVQWFTKQI